MKSRRIRLISMIMMAMMVLTMLVTLPGAAHVAHAMEYLGGKIIDIRSSNGGNLVSARLDAGNALQSTAHVAQAWEQFLVVDQGGGRFALQAQANGKYVTARVDLASAPLQANASSPQAWEMFYLIDDGGGYISFKSAQNNLYVSADSNYANTPLMARSGSIQGWEKFQYDKIGSGGAGGSGFSAVVSEAQFSSFFPNRNGFYTYSNLVTAVNQSYPDFANGNNRSQEAAAFLANVAHETGGLVYVEEIDKSGNYCDTSRSYGCPAGQNQYYGRGPLQISWNFNYKAAGDYFGTDLLHNPWWVSQDGVITWKAALWYWYTQNGPGYMTGHNAMINGNGFGETIRSINGSLECNQPGGSVGNNEMWDRVNRYNSFTGTLGGGPGSGSETC